MVFILEVTAIYSVSNVILNYFYVKLKIPIKGPFCSWKLIDIFIIEFLGIKIINIINKLINNQ